MNRKAVASLIWIVTACVLLAACGSRQTTSENENPYDIKVDGPPDSRPPVASVEPVPRYEPLSRYGNHSPYTVRGKTYRVLGTSEGYRARGNASWYGRKFHGRKTSSGEIYDMFQFTAAHRELPLPSYLEVTNLNNGRSAIVRVNDRGPFHSDRVLDLSYAAAEKLDIIASGTAPVEIRAINVLTAGGSTGVASGNVWLQIGAYRQQSAARRVQRQLQQSGVSPTQVTVIERNGSRLWRVRSGPYENVRELRTAEQSISDLGLGPALRVGDS